MNSKMKRMIVSLEEKQMAILKRLSVETHRSVSELVRRAVSEYTQEESAKNPAQLLLEAHERRKKRFKKAFKNVDPNLSKKIDKIVYGI